MAVVVEVAVAVVVKVVIMLLLMLVKSVTCAASVVGTARCSSPVNARVTFVPA